MYAIANKLLLVIIIELVTISLTASKIMPLLEISAGDIVNINYLKESSTETTGNIFDGYREGEFTKTDYFTEVSIDDTEHDPTKIFSSADRVKYNYFGISQNYIDNRYLYGIVKICKVKKTQNLNIRVIDGSDFPNINYRRNDKLLLGETAVLRLKGNNGTHFVSSITTGECLLQVYVNEAEKCTLTDGCEKEKRFNDFFEWPLYRSRVIIASNKRDLENQVNEDLNNSRKSLFDLSNDPMAYPSILNLLMRNAVIRIKLHSLPELPKSRIRSVQNPITHKTPLKSLKPGDIINASNLKAINSSITVDNILVDVYDGKIDRSMTFKYTDCFEYDVNEIPILNYVSYKTYPNYLADYYYKFDLFDEMVKRKYYGIDRKYLNNKYKCMKITICSEFERKKLIIPSVRVISLGKQNIRNSSIFIGENVVLRYKINNETHYVARTEEGNCLFQALVFPNDDINREYNTLNLYPLYTGKIISATNDPVFEKWAENFVSYLTVIHSKTLMGVINDPETKAIFFSQFAFNNHNKTLINIYLDDLH
ncbi:uncharacterized protein LOC130674308 isoform X2 [Microplitis mediator]|uniref:uncharacterized protein LOC130674308 isoform X2 n=1 Tax=Microplitis mediator TaxID=375433 RepID=UPI002555774F|nr:uncharacterized protein LOC130674308 isoform X2 [Microplitis mediator]